MPRPPIERTPFGERLLAARKYSKLSQEELAKRVGLSQSALAESEKTGQGSTKILQIAAATGVDPKWLATGQGHMVSHVQEEFPPYPAGRGLLASPPPLPLHSTPTARILVTQLGEILERHGQLARLSVAPLLQRLAEHPEEREAIADHVSRVLTTQGNPPAPGSSSSPKGALRESLGNASVNKER